MGDFITGVRVSPGLTFVVRTATANGNTIDRRGFDAVSFCLFTGVGGITFTGTNRLDWVIQHSDDGSTWADVTTGDILAPNGRELTIVSNGRVESWTSAKAAESTTHVEYIGRKRYSRAVASFGGTHGTGTLVGATALLSQPTYAPTA
jgi:hypothetical protein